MRDAGDVQRTARPAWVVVTLVFSVVGVGTAVGSVLLLVNGAWIGAVFGLLQVVACYWLAIGAWLRTPWADLDRREQPPDPPSLSDSRARLYVLLAALSIVAATIALAFQAMDAG